MNRNLVRILGHAVFFLGASLGLALAVVMIWNKVEAIHYYFDGAKYERFNGLRCPLMIAPAEKGIVTAAFKNPTDREVNFFYRAEISGSVSTRRVEDSLVVPPHQTKNIWLAVDVNDVDLLFFIFVKVNILPNSLHGSEQSICGIRVAKLLGLAGRQISAAGLTFSFLGMATGLGMSRQTGDKKDRTIERVMQVLGVIVLLTLITGATGLWLPGMALSAITILLMLISVRIAIA